MRVWPACVVAVSLIWPTAAFGACDQDEIDALTKKSQEVMAAWSQKMPNKTPQKVQALSATILTMTEEAQKKAESGDTEASCQLIRDITTLFEN